MALKNATDAIVAEAIFKSRRSCENYSFLEKWGFGGTKRKMSPQPSASMLRAGAPLSN